MAPADPKGPDVRPAVFPNYGGPDVDAVPWPLDPGRPSIRPWSPEGAVAEPIEPAPEGKQGREPTPIEAPEPPPVVAPARTTPPPPPPPAPAVSPELVAENEALQARIDALEEAAAEAEEQKNREKNALVEGLRESYLAAADRLEAATVELSQRLGEDVVALALRLAGAVVRRAVELDTGILVETVREALRTAGAVERLTLRCHPDDLTILRDRAPGLAAEQAGRNVEVLVQASHDVERGGCIVLFDEGLVDARLGNQLAHLASAAERVIQEHFSTVRDPDEEAPP